MRLIDIGIGLLVLLILGGSLLGVKVFADPERKLVRNTDAEVVETALLGLYSEHADRIVDWSNNPFVLINPECGFSTPHSGDFNSEVRKAIAHSKENQAQGDDVADLEALAKRYDGQSCPVPATHLDLKTLRIDPCLVVRKDDAQSFVENRRGEFGAIRFRANLKPPFYSPDRQAAVLCMTNTVPGKEVVFFLRHESGHWKLIYTHFIN